MRVPRDERRRARVFDRLPARVSVVGRRRSAGAIRRADAQGARRQGREDMQAPADRESRVRLSRSVARLRPRCGDFQLQYVCTVMRALY